MQQRRVKRKNKVCAALRMWCYNEEANVDPLVPEVEAPQSHQSLVTKEPSLSFFMHDFLGGSHPLARIVTGIVANSDVTGLSFSKHNNSIFPITGVIPLVNPKLNGIITNNNLPFVAGLAGLGNGQSSSTIFQN